MSPPLPVPAAATAVPGSRPLTLLLGLTGVVHLLPLSGVLGAGRLQALYGTAVSDPALLLLLQHRAVLFGLLGTLMLASVLRPALRAWSTAAALVSMLSFALLYDITGAQGSSLLKVVWIDLGLSAGLLAALAWQTLARHRT